MTIVEASYKHAESARKALDYLKDLTSSLDGFDFSQEKNGVKLYSKKVEGSQINIVRGDTVLKTTQYTPRQLAAVANESGTRATWDEKFDSAEVREMYTCFEYLFWSKHKAPWPVSPRDFVGIALTDVEDDVCYVSMSSVEDESVPPTSGCVRGKLLVSGWKLYKTEDGVGIIYVTQVDLCGSIPASLLKSINLQIPLCAGTLADYVQKYGFPPYVVSSTAQHKAVSFDHGKRQFTTRLEGDDAECQFLTSKQMYPNGVKVQVEGGAEYAVTEVEHGNHLVIVKNVKGSATVVISKS